MSFCTLEKMRYFGSVGTFYVKTLVTFGCNDDTSPELNPLTLSLLVVKLIL
jgi:hypothetical protein